MAEEFYPFSDSPVATELQWSRMARIFAGDGVALTNPLDAALKVTANGTSTISVAAGEAIVNGFKYRNDTTKSLSVPTNFGNASPRVDRVVLRCSQTANSVIATYRTGGSLAPALATDRNDVFDIPLAQVTVAAGATVAQNSAVIDQRYSATRPAAGLLNAPNAAGMLRYADGLLDIGDGSAWHPIPLGDGPRCMAYQSGTGEVLANGVGKNLILNSELYDSSNMHATSGDPAFRKVFAPIDGVYSVQASVSFDVSASGVRNLAIVKNMVISSGGAGTGGSAIARAGGPASSGETSLNCGIEVLLAAGDWLSLLTTQSSGGNLGMNPGPDRTFLQVRWIRSAL